MSATELSSRRDSNVNLMATTPAEAEFGYDITNKRPIIGDASKAGGHPVATWLDIQNQVFNAVTAGGAADAITLTFDTQLAPSAYAARQRFSFIAANDNTGSATLNVNGLGAKTIKKNSAGSKVNLSLGDISSGLPYDVTYDGTDFVLMGGIGEISGLHNLLNYGDGSDGAISWSGTTTEAPGLYQATTFAVAAGAVITMSRRGVWVIRATTSIIINGSSAHLSADEMGAVGSTADDPADDGIYGGSGGGGSALAGTGDGGPSLYTDGGAAGTGLFGAGGAGAAQSSNVRELLLATLPMINAHVNNSAHKLGGGGGGTGNGAAGGDGGGVIILCAPAITVASGGSLTADGGAGVGSVSRGAGGGGGGTLIIATPSGGYSHPGTVRAAGGAGGSSGGYVGGTGGAGNVIEVTL